MYIMLVCKWQCLHPQDCILIWIYRMEINYLTLHYFNSNSLCNNTCNIGTWSADITYSAITPHPHATLKVCNYHNGPPSHIPAVDSACLAVYISIRLCPYSEFVLIHLHDRATLYPLCSDCSQIMRQRCARSRCPDALGGNSPKVLSVKISSVIIVINIKNWTLWSVPFPKLQLLSPTFLQSSNCSPSFWSVEVWFQRDLVLWHSLQVLKPVLSVFIYPV